MVPLAFWKTESIAYVTFVVASPNVEGHFEPELFFGRYDRQDDKWVPDPQVVHQRLEHQDQEHIETLSSQFKLAASLWELGHRRAAKEQLEHVVAVQSRTLPEDDYRQLMAREWLATWSHL